MVAITRSMKTRPEVIDIPTALFHLQNAMKKCHKRQFTERITDLLHNSHIKRHEKSIK